MPRGQKIWPNNVNLRPLLGGAAARTPRCATAPSSARLEPGSKMTNDAAALVHDRRSLLSVIFRATIASDQHASRRRSVSVETAAPWIGSRGNDCYKRLYQAVPRAVLNTDRLDWAVWQRSESLGCLPLAAEPPGCSHARMASRSDHRPAPPLRIGNRAPTRRPAPMRRNDKVRSPLIVLHYPCRGA